MKKPRKWSKVIDGKQVEVDGNGVHVKYPSGGESFFSRWYVKQAVKDYDENLRKKFMLRFGCFHWACSRDGAPHKTQ